jgi:hypothetical protein
VGEGLWLGGVFFVPFLALPCTQVLPLVAAQSGFLLAPKLLRLPFLALPKALEFLVLLPPDCLSLTGRVRLGGQNGTLVQYG